MSLSHYFNDLPSATVWLGSKRHVRSLLRNGRFCALSSRTGIDQGRLQWVAFGTSARPSANGRYLRTAVVPALCLSGRQSTSAVGATGSSHPSNPRPSAAPPPIGGRFMMTKPERSRCSTRRFATIAGIACASPSNERSATTRPRGGANQEFFGRATPAGGNEGRRGGFPASAHGAKRFAPILALPRSSGKHREIGNRALGRAVSGLMRLRDLA